jgi:hypothetical protein
MATLFTFAPAEIDRAVSGHNKTRRRFRFRWTVGSRTEMLTLDRGSGPDGAAKLEIL